MKKPETLEQFKNIIKSMQHRERFVFDCKEYGKQMEIYFTTLYETQSLESNINLQFIAEDGKGQNKQNKLLKLWTNKTFENIYNLIK